MYWLIKTFWIGANSSCTKNALQALKQEITILTTKACQYCMNTFPLINEFIHEVEVKDRSSTMTFSVEIRPHITDVSDIHF